MREELGFETVITGYGLTETCGVVTMCRHDDDPETNPEAQLLTELTYMDVLARGLAVMDSTAITMAMDNALPIRVFSQVEPDNIAKAVRGEPVGTLVR